MNGIVHFSLLNQQTLVRKASCVTFSSDGRCVLVGDKNGDVYSVTADPGTRSGQETTSQDSHDEVANTSETNSRSPRAGS